MPDATNEGVIKDEVSRQLVSLHKEMYGTGPTEARTYYVDDLLVCVLRGGFTKIEESLRRAGREQAVIDQRAEWQAMMTDRFVGVVEQETGRRVLGFMSGNQQAPDMIAEVFVLDPN